MTNLTGIREHMEVIGADGVHVGIVDRVEDNRIKLARSDSEDYRHHFIDAGPMETSCGYRPMRT